MLISVAETPGYLRRAERLLTAGARAEIVNLLAARPKAGDLIRGTGASESCAGHAAAAERAEECA